MTLSRSLTARALVSIGAMLLTAVPTLLPMAEGSEWGVRFPPAEGAVRDRLEFELRPGEAAADAIDLINRSDAELTVAVTPVDAEYGADNLAFAVEGEPVSGGRWLTPHASTHRLPPSTEQPLEFVVSVPADATPGAYAAALRLTQRAGPTITGEIPVQRTIVVIAHITVSGDTGLAETAAPLPDWIIAPVITAGVLLILAGIVTLILLRARARGRAPRREPE